LPLTGKNIKIDVALKAIPDPLLPLYKNSVNLNYLIEKVEFIKDHPKIRFGRINPCSDRYFQTPGERTLKVLIPNLDSIARNNTIFEYV